VTPIPGSFEKYVEPASDRKSAATEEDPSQRWPSLKTRGYIRTELKKSKNVDVSLKPLTAAEYEEWYEIWDKEVGEKPGACASGRRISRAR